MENPGHFSAEINSDTAIWHSETLVVQSIQTKLIQIADRPLVIGARGDIAIVIQLLGPIVAASAGKTVDVLIAEFAAALDAASRSSMTVPEGMDFLAAGYSESEGQFLRYAAVDEAQAAAVGFKPWQLVDAPSPVLLTTMKQQEFDEGGFYSDDFRYGLHHHGVRLLKAVRTIERTWNGRPLVPCGGTLLLATIRPSGVTYNPMGGWADLVGQPIQRDAPWIEQCR